MYNDNVLINNKCCVVEKVVAYNNQEHIDNSTLVKSM